MQGRYADGTTVYNIWELAVFSQPSFSGVQARWVCNTGLSLLAEHNPLRGCPTRRCSLKDLGIVPVLWLIGSFAGQNSKF